MQQKTAIEWFQIALVKYWQLPLTACKSSNFIVLLNKKYIYPKKKKEIQRSLLPFYVDFTRALTVDNNTTNFGTFRDVFGLILFFFFF